jgi:hypothetical protein
MGQGSTETLTSKCVFQNASSLGGTHNFVSDAKNASIFYPNEERKKRTSLFCAEVLYIVFDLRRGHLNITNELLAAVKVTKKLQS